MILKPQDRLYFIHIPKTGGTSLIPHLDARFHVGEICPAQLWSDLLLLPQEVLPHYRLFRGHFGAKGLDPFLPEPPVRVTMLRHPVPLALSTYKFILREPGTQLHRLVKSCKMSFADFLGQPKTRLAVTNKQVRNLSFELCYQPSNGPTISSAREANPWVNEHKVVSRSPKEQFKQAWAVLEDCAFFGLVEYFDESMALLSWTFGWPPIGQVQKLMVAPSSSSPEPQQISEPLATQIYACNTLDLELYRKAEQLFRERLATMLEGLKQYALAGEAMPESFSQDPVLIRRLLERHYHHCQRGRANPRGASVRVTFAEPLQGSGWHNRERAPHDGTVYRWTGPDTISSLNVPVPLVSHEDLVVTFLVLDVASRDVLNDMELKVNGYPVDLRPIAKRPLMPMYYRGYIPKHFLPSENKEIQLTFHVTKTMRRGPSYGDPRAVGMAINWVEVSSIQQAMPEETLASMLKDVCRPRRLRQWVLQIPWIGPRLRILYLQLRAAYLSKTW